MISMGSPASRRRFRSPAPISSTGSASLAPPGPAEGRVVLQLEDRGLRRAQRARGIARELHLVEPHGEGVVEEQAAHEGLPDAEQDLEGLGGLDGPDDPREDAEDAPLGAARDESREAAAPGRGSGSRARGRLQKTLACPSKRKMEP